MLARAGDLADQPAALDGGLRRVLQAIEQQVQHSRFFFGSRPSIGDFGHYGQLSQLAVDPTPSEIMRRDAVRTYQWQLDLDDASGIEGEWRDPQAPLGPGVVALLQLAGDTYLPFLVANAAAIAAGTKTYDLKLHGKSYPNPTRSYKRRCLLWLKAALAEVQGEPRARLEDDPRSNTAAGSRCSFRPARTRWSRRSCRSRSVRWIGMSFCALLIFVALAAAGAAGGVLFARRRAPLDRRQ